MNSKRKGKTGELLLVQFLVEHGFPARRGVQYRGDLSAPDVICPTLPFHLECKFTQRLSLRDAVAQAGEDSEGRPWAVLHKWNHGPWLAILPAAEFLSLVRAAKASPPRPECESVTTNAPIVDQGVK